MARLQVLIFDRLNDDDGTEIAYDDPDFVAPVTPLVGTLDVSVPAEPRYTGILKGGLYTRPIKESGDGATPIAFWQTARGGANRPSGYVRNPARNPHRQADSVPGAYLAIAHVYLYADRSDSGHEALEAAQLRIRQLTHGWRVQTAWGPYAFGEYIDAAEPFDTEEFLGAIATFVRIGFTSRYSNEV